MSFIKEFIRKRQERKIFKANGGKDKLSDRAKEMGFPLVLRDRYLYALGTGDNMTLPRYKKWKAFMNEECGIKTHASWEELHEPAKATETHIGTYKVFKHYRCRGYNSMGDYAMGDSGYNGDLVLVRIDKI